MPQILVEGQTVKNVRKKKRTNIPRKKLNPPLIKTPAGGPENNYEQEKQKRVQGGINFESLMIKSVEDKILDSKLNMDNIYNIIGGGSNGGNTGAGEGGGVTGGGSEKGRQGDKNQMEKCSRVRVVNESGDVKESSSLIKKEEAAEMDRSRRSKYFKIITPEKFIKVNSESETNQKTVTDFNYIEFMHPLRSASKSKSTTTKADENLRK